MKLENSILEDVREYVGLARDSLEFDIELTTHINNALLTLNQNGVGNVIVVNDTEPKWLDFKNNEQVNGNVIFPMVMSYVTLSTKIVFDPPPPSAVEFYSNSLTERLWRIRQEYEPYNVVEGGKR